MSDNLPVSNYPASSRYHSTPVAEITLSDGRKVAYMRRRLLPQPGRFVLLHEHIAAEGERPDHVAEAWLGDPEQYWRICDANDLIHPDELTATVGRRIRITLPEGIPGASDG